MKKFYFNEEAAKRAINEVNKVVEVFNNNNKSAEITLDDLRLILENPQAFKDKVFLAELKRICEDFAQDFDEVKTKEYYWKNPMFSKMANNRCKDLYALATSIFRCGAHRPQIVDYLEIDNGVLSPVLDYENKINAAYTYKTKNKKQDEIVDALRKLTESVKELNALGVQTYQVAELLFNDLEIKPTAIYRY